MFLPSQACPKECEDLFPEKGESVVEMAVSSTKARQTREIIDVAINAGLTEQQAQTAAIKGGATAEQVAKR